MEQLAVLNPENVTEEEARDYSVREAVRAVVIDENNLIALLHVAEKQYYKLPGGGIEGTEDKATALARECLEEIGSGIEVVGEIGSFEQVWLPFQDALNVLSQNKATSAEGKDYIVPRDTVFLQAARKFIKS